MTQRFIANANFALAQKFGHGGFKVYKPKSTYYFNVGEERLTAVVKVIPSAKIADIEKEVKKWTRDGTLLAYATSGRTTSLILKVKTPEWGDHPPSVQEKTALMHKAIVQAPDYGYEWVVHIGAYEENFVWGRAKGDPKGKWRAEIVDWARDWSEK
ncbi:hypothetical protein AX14_010472 [Amanita brunnescens Koide BX004]|nr:hypothetical protein AX14_010472 [Amanita brunnescens Koide BX004]